MIFLIALRKELLEQWRSYRLLVVSAVLAVMGLMSPLLAKMTPEIIKLIPGGEQIAMIIPPPSTMDAIAQYIKNIGQFGLILALVTAMGAVAQEKDKGTAAMMLVKPLSRGAFLGSKFIAFSLTFLAGLIIAGLACYYYTLLLFEPLNLGKWLALNGLMWLYLVVHVAVTLFFSTISRSQAVAGGLSFGALMLLSLLGSLPGIGEYVPGQMLNWGAGLYSGMVGSAWPAFGVSLALILVAFLGAWFVLEKQEL
jgi:ABC-2 type transport system permease protein